MGSENYVEAIDEHLVLHMHRTGMTQKELATRLGMTEETLSNKRRHKSEFKLSELCSINKELGISLDELLCSKV